MKKTLIAIIFIPLLIYITITTFNKPKLVKIIEKEVFTVQNEEISINKYYIYGTHLNIEGTLNIDISDITDIDVSLYNTKEQVINTIYNINNNTISFTLSKNINDGINLETLENNEYYLFLKVTKSDKTTYYTFKNSTSYSNLVYNSISKNNKQVDLITTDKYNSKPSFKLVIKTIPTPTDVYDVVIDPGHGNIDPGATNGNYYERESNLVIAKAIKEQLTTLGYKVALTRNDNNIYIPTYGTKGRVTVPFITKAKLLVSIHQNSTAKDAPLSGVEVYVPNHTNIAFATNVAKNIKEIANTPYSNSEDYKVSDGVYMRTFYSIDITEFKDELKALNITFYESINTDTNYYNILRETGGMITGAYVDGREKTKEANLHINSNIAAESYLLELGYLSNNVDLNNLKNNRDKYITAIVNSIDNKYK